MTFGNNIKHLWFLDEDVVFLNHASFGATPKSVLKTEQKWHEQLERQPLHFFMDEYYSLIRNSAAELASFVGANPDELVFVENATSGMNTVFKNLMLNLKPGDEILSTNHIYPAVKNLISYVCDISGARFIEVPILMPVESSEVIIEEIAKKITEKTKIASFDHITSPTGLIFPVKELVELCKNHGITTIIDGAHAPGMLDLNINSLNCDFYTGNCHKWLFTPKGCALLKVPVKFQDNFHPLTISLFYKQGFLHEFDWVGTKNPSSWLSVSNAIRFYNEIGKENIQKYIHHLISDAGKMLTEALGTEMPCPENMLGSIIAIRMPDSFKPEPSYVNFIRADFLKQYKIEVPFTYFDGKVYVRPAAQIYNEMKDYEILRDALLDFIKKNI